MRSSQVVKASDSQCQSATLLGSIPASSDTVESEGRQMKQLIKYYETKKNSILKEEENKTSTLISRVFNFKEGRLCNFWSLNEEEARHQPPPVKNKSIFKIQTLLCIVWHCCGLKEQF